MKTEFHPAFPGDVRRFAGEYASLSTLLGSRFGAELDAAIEAIKAAPRANGHILRRSTRDSLELRRRNLRAFPHFVSYAVVEERLIFIAVIASRSDPLLWLRRSIEK